MKLSELITSPDGSLSLTKCAALVAHTNLAAAFAVITIRHGFIGEMWLTYGGFAILHASYDKTVQVVKAYKDKKLATEKI